ncbi:hypothetical protein Tco_0819471 [Tanacetum coccineum]|uniref:MAK10-like protein n=1 Tax=Tanacetum coccineum TaxID=301880 RepID=A0ABQ5A9S5_9ASTR
MGDENPIRTLGDYSKPSHEGYRNTSELPLGNNVVPLRSDTIRLMQNGCSFHGLRSEDPNQHLKDFLKLMDSLDLDGENKERTRLQSLSEAWTRFKDLLQKVPHHDLDLWLQVQLFYDQATIDKLAQYEDEGWNNPVIPEEGNLDYENPDIEHLLGVMEYKVDTLMKDALLLIGGNESMFRMTSNETYRLPPEPSRQEEFEHIVTNFILGQEERVRQLEEYMKAIVGDFMQLSLKVVEKLKDEIRGEENRVKKIKKITSYPENEDLKPSSNPKFS